MALLGSGVMAFWNNIADGGDAEFLEWHVLEHIPERVGIPGFLRGRRYVAHDGEPRYFNFYETADADVLSSPAYHARLNAPTDWTRRSLGLFRDSNRTLCAVAASIGRGEGAAIETLRLTSTVAADGFRSSVSALLTAALRERGIVAAHLLEGLTAASRAGTAEKALRNQPDQVADWVVMIEAVDAQALESARKGAARDEAFRKAGAGDIVRGIYRLQYGLSNAEMKLEASAPDRWT